MTLQKIDEDIFTITDFLSPERCEALIALSESLGYEKAKISMGKQQITASHIRNNERVIYDNAELANDLWAILQNFTLPDTETGYAKALNERLRFYRYWPEQQFKSHKDGSYFRNIHEWSSYTFMIYLNDDMEGGSTTFEGEVWGSTAHIIYPQTGMALIFRHDLVHEGTAVTRGVKYVLRSDIMYRRHGY